MSFDSGAFRCFITLERSKCSAIRSSAGERSDLAKVASGGFWLLTSLLEQLLFRVHAVDANSVGQQFGGIL